MNVHELYDAIGQADEVYVAHSEQTVTRGRRIGLRVGLIAAVLIAALSFTAAASPAFREWLFGVHELHEEQIARPVAIEGEDFGVFSEGKLEIRPEVDLIEGYPTTIETFYVPTVLAESWRPGVICADDPDGYIEHLREECCLYWDDPNADPPRAVRFCQYTGRYLELDTPMTWINIGYHQGDSGYHIEEIELAGIPMQHVRVEASSVELDHGFASSSGADYYFWTDGSYIFSLGLPLDTELSLVEDVVASLAPVDDITQYLDLRKDEGMVLVDEPPLTVRYQPTWIPEGWVQLDTSKSQEPWYAAFAWKKEGPGTSILTMQQTTVEDYSVSIEFTWQSGMEEYKKTSVQIGTVEASLYESESRIQLLLPLEDSVIELETYGPQKLSIEEIIQIAEQLKPIP